MSGPIRAYYGNSGAEAIEAAIKLCAHPQLDALLAPAIAFGELPARLADILKPRSGVLCQLVSYS